MGDSGKKATDFAAVNHTHANAATLDTSDVTWANSWADYGSSYAIRIFKDYDGTIHMQGLIKSGTIGATAFTLPSGYRPTSGGYYSVAAYGGTNGIIRILTDGTVYVYQGSATWTSIESCFR